MRTIATALCGLVMVVLALVIAPQAGPLHAQEEPPCGVASVVTMPIDTSAYRLAQDFAVASPRHQGRYHTGEDWIAGPGETLGQPVRAIGDGRVTFSSPIGWGRDGGVIIIEHTLPDGSLIYSQYGHIAERDDITFPARLSCVGAGDVIAAIGDARPAPHLHFEIRVNQPDIPGPGYTRENPASLGWRRPSQVVTNLQAYAHPAHAWHYTGESLLAAPPLVLADTSMLALDGSVLRGVTYDGRVLWRVRLETAAVEVAASQGGRYLVYSDGTVSRIGDQGATESQVTLDFRPAGPPLLLPDGRPVYPTQDGALVALNPTRDAIDWRLDDVPRIRHMHVGANLIALVTADERRILFVNPAGERVSEAALRSGAALATSRNGDLIVYSAGGLWRVNADGAWSLALPDAEPALPPGGGASAVTIGDDGSLILTDGTALYAYDDAGVLLWETGLPQPLAGLGDLTLHFGAVLVTSSRGHIVVADQTTGRVCGFTRIYGDDRAAPWHDLGDDGVLRVAGAGSVIGLDWLDFAGPCTTA